MPEKPVFGLRSRKTEGPAAVETASSPHGPEPADTDARTTPNLAALAFRVARSGKFLALVGLAVAFVAWLIWPSDPIALHDLGDRIYLPPILKDAFVALRLPQEVRLYSQSVIPSLTNAGLANPVFGWLLVSGLAAVSFERWVVAGLIAASAIFPWAVLGFRFEEGGLVVSIMAVAAIARITKPSPGRVAALVLGGLVLGNWVVRPTLNVAEKAISSAFVDLSSVSYETVFFPALVKAEPTAATLVRLDASGAAAAAAKPYAVAQELAFRHDAPGAVAALAEAAVAGFAPNAFDQKRIDAIRRYATAAGALGDAAREELRSADQVRWWAAMLLGWIAFLLALVRPATDILSKRLIRRGARIETAQRRIEAQYNALAHGDPTAATGSGAIRSIAAMDGKAVAAAIASRINAYWLSAACLAIAMVVFTLGAWWFWLPSPADHTGFESVSLSYKLAHAAGIADPPGSFSGVLYVILVGGAVVMVVRTLRASPIWQRVGLLLIGGVALILWQAPTRHSEYEIAPAAIHQEILARWQAAAENSADKVSQSESAYALAELSYIDGRAADAQTYLTRITDFSTLVLVHRQKIDLMRRWVAASGIPVPSASAVAAMPPELGAVYFIGTVLWYLALASATLALVPLGLGLFASQRRRRIDTLVEQRDVLLGQQPHREY